MNHIHPDQLQELRTTLCRREEELKAHLGEYLHGGSESGSLMFANHTETAGDFAGANVLADRDIAIVRHDLLELYEIQEALKRIDNRTYGMCVQCGDEIPVARLTAQPSALFCTPCQDFLEKISGLQFNARI